MTKNSMLTRGSQTEEIQDNNQRLKINVSFQRVELSIDITMHAIKATRRHFIVLLVHEADSNESQMLVRRRRELTLARFKYHRTWILNSNAERRMDIKLGHFLRMRVCDSVNMFSGC